MAIAAMEIAGVSEVAIMTTFPPQGDGSEVWSTFCERRNAFQRDRAVGEQRRAAGGRDCGEVYAEAGGKEDRSRW